MFEKVLDLPPSAIHKQETFFHCGPASAENILMALGIHAEEWELATACRTTENGTDWIGQIRDVLAQRAHNINWQLVEMPNDPPTPQQRQKLWDDVFTSIVHANCPVLINIVVPPGNYPRASRPYNGEQANLRYGGGTVYHYATIFGVAEEDSGSKHFLMLDSGFTTPGGSHAMWCTADQMATMIPPKGYVFGHAEAPKLPGPAPEPQPGVDKADLLSRAMGGSLSIERYRELWPHVEDALRRSECTTPERVAQWMAQIGHESAGLRYMREIADGSAYEGRADLGNVHPGDGVRYAGRGPIQITGRSNYEQLSRWAFEKGYAPSPTYFVDNPVELESDTFAFLGPIWYWTVARPAINSLCDAGNIEGVTRAINGGLHGIDDRRQRYAAALPIAGQLLPGPEPGTPPPPPAPEPEKAATPLSGRPHHHSQVGDDRELLLDMRAEGLLTQALVFAIAEKAGVNARELYDNVRGSF